MGGGVGRSSFAEPDYGGSAGPGYEPENPDAAVARAGAGVAQGMLDALRDEVRDGGPWKELPVSDRIAFAQALATVAQTNALLALVDKLDEARDDTTTAIGGVGVTVAAALTGGRSMPDHM